MFFIGEVNWYDIDENTSLKDSVLICEESYTDAINIITNHYGEDYIESLVLEVFAPGNILSFDSTKDKELMAFARLSDLKDSIIW